MCIACEMQMFFAMEDIPPSTETASHDKADEAQRFVCEAPAETAPFAGQTSQDERKP